MTTDEPTLFDPEYRNGRHRSPDWVTSIAGANSVAYRAGSQKARLLAEYKRALPLGLTDDEAAEACDLSRTCFWKRCSELRQDGAIVVTSTRKSSINGELRIECTYNTERGA